MPSLLRTPTGQAISEYIQSLIFEGTLRPGTRIDREQIAHEVGTSQIPVREALLRLEAEGAIVIEPHRGAFVAPVTEETVEEHWELMGLITGLVVAKVAEHQDPEVLAELRTLVGRMRRARDVDEFNQASIAVTRLINHAGATAKLRNVLRQFSRQVPGNFYQRIPGSMECALSSYQRMLGAIEAGDADGARQAALEYMRDQGDNVMAVLRANGVISPTPAEADATGTVGPAGAEPEANGAGRRAARPRTGGAAASKPPTRRRRPPTSP